MIYYAYYLSNYLDMASYNNMESDLSKRTKEIFQFLQEAYNLLPFSS